MKSIVFLISTAVACTWASSLVSIPFTAIERVGNSISSAASKKLADLVDVPLKNIDLAYLIDIEIGNVLYKYILKLSIYVYI